MTAPLNAFKEVACLTDVGKVCIFSLSCKRLVELIAKDLLKVNQS